MDVQLSDEEIIRQRREKLLERKTQKEREKAAAAQTVAPVMIEKDPAPAPAPKLTSPVKPDLEKSKSVESLKPATPITPAAATSVATTAPPAAAAAAAAATEGAEPLDDYEIRKREREARRNHLKEKAPAAQPSQSSPPGAYRGVGYKAPAPQVKPAAAGSAAKTSKEEVVAETNPAPASVPASTAGKTTGSTAVPPSLGTATAARGSASSLTSSSNPRVSKWEPVKTGSLVKTPEMKKSEEEKRKAEEAQRKKEEQEKEQERGAKRLGKERLEKEKEQQAEVKEPEVQAEEVVVAEKEAPQGATEQEKEPEVSRSESSTSVAEAVSATADKTSSAAQDSLSDYERRRAEREAKRKGNIGADQFRAFPGSNPGYLPKTTGTAPPATAASAPTLTPTPAAAPAAAAPANTNRFSTWRATPPPATNPATSTAARFDDLEARRKAREAERKQNEDEERAKSQAQPQAQPQTPQPQVPEVIQPAETQVERDRRLREEERLARRNERMRKFDEQNVKLGLTPEQKTLNTQLKVPQSLLPTSRPGSNRSRPVSIASPVDLQADKAVETVDLTEQAVAVSTGKKVVPKDETLKARRITTAASTQSSPNTEVADILAQLEAINVTFREATDLELCEAKGAQLKSDMKALMPRLQAVSRKFPLDGYGLVEKYNVLAKEIPAKITAAKKTAAASEPETGVSLLRCAKCRTQMEGPMVELFGRTYHQRCFGCFDCGRQLSKSCLNIDGHPYCERCGKKAWINSRLKNRQSSSL